VGVTTGDDEATQPHHTEEEIMNTTYRTAPGDLFRLVAFAVLAGVVLALTIAVLHGPDGATPAPQIVPASAVHVAQPVPHCFAMPHYPSIELARSGCFH
jgi:hypothetical protein